MTTSPQPDPDKLKLYLATIFGSLGGAMTSALICLCDRLGLYKALHELGAATSSELACATGLLGEGRARDVLRSRLHSLRADRLRPPDQRLLRRAAVNRLLDVASSFFVTAGRFVHGVSVGRLGARPELPLQLYDFEGCPYCRKVREALSVLDLDADVFPCPKNGPRFREDVKRRGGKAQFPFLVDPNASVEMYESDAIVQYLFERYGDGNVPLALSLGPLTDLSAQLAGLWRPGFGVFYERGAPPEKPLELWSFEASPFCRIVREKLCTLEIPYRLHNVAKASPGRDAFVRRSGKMMVPFLVDPNTGVSMFESAEIVRYLDSSYGERA